MHLELKASFSVQPQLHDHPPGTHETHPIALMTLARSKTFEGARSPTFIDVFFFGFGARHIMAKQGNWWKICGWISSLHGLWKPLHPGWQQRGPSYAQLPAERKLGRNIPREGGPEDVLGVAVVGAHSPLPKYFDVHARLN